ncbi:MAG: hypothetical protein WB697_14705 [Stellaceae bacterium]
MPRLLLLSAAAAAILSLAGPAQAQPVHAIRAFPEVVIPPANPYPPEIGATIGSDINCEPPGLPPSGIGALPPSNHTCP